MLLSVGDFAAVIRRVIREHAILLNIHTIYRNSGAGSHDSRVYTFPQPFPTAFRESAPDSERLRQQ